MNILGRNLSSKIYSSTIKSDNTFSPWTSHKINNPEELPNYDPTISGYAPFPPQTVCYPITSSSIYVAPSWYNGKSFVLIYNISSGKYTNINETTSNHSISFLGSCLQIYNSKLYAIGGSKTGQPSVTTMYFDLLHYTWHILSFKLTIARALAGCAAGTWRGIYHIYVFGGYTPVSIIGTNSIEAWCPPDSSSCLDEYSDWQLLNTRMKTNRKSHTCVSYNEFIFCIGGISAWAGHTVYGLATVEIFNTYSMTSLDFYEDTTQITMHNPRINPATIIMNIFGYNHLLIIGGDLSVTGTIEIYYDTNSPTPSPTNLPTLTPTYDPTIEPTQFPTNSPTLTPTRDPTIEPTIPTYSPTQSPQDTNYIYINNNDNLNAKLTFINFIYAASGIIGIVLFMILIGYIHQKYYAEQSYNFGYISLLKFVIYLLDFIADLFFCINLYYRYDSEEHVMYLGLFIASVVFIILPSGISLYEMEKFISRYIKKYGVSDTKMNEYFAKYSYLLYVVGFIVGNIDATLSLFSCNLFDSNVFGME
eukprot:438698_1